MTIEDRNQVPVIVLDDGTLVDGARLRVHPGDLANKAIRIALVASSAPISTKTDLAPASPTFATVGLTSAQAVPTNANRRGLVLVNTSDFRISLGFGVAAVLDSGITLYPQGVFVMDEYTFDTSQVNAIASAAGSNLAVQEYT